jgi:hypothetical protein
MTEHFQSGAVIDERSEEAKGKDYFITETVSAFAPVDWVEKPRASWRKFRDQDQDGSGSCVAQTIKKLAGVQLWLEDGTYVEPSATTIYQYRSNKPQGGMIGVEAFDIWKDYGIGLEAFTPSQLMNDEQMDSVKIEKYKKDIAKVFSITGHIGIRAGAFEEVASVIQTTQKAVMVWFFFNNEEWSREIPMVIDPNTNPYTAWARHSVACVDFTLVDGKKYLVIEDSAHFGGLTRRLISEEFFTARNFFARYAMNFRFKENSQDVIPPPETHKFKDSMFYIPLDAKGNISDMVLHEKQKAEVMKLQDILKHEGLFALNIDSTGYYGAITAKAVLLFQKKYAVAPNAELDSLGGRYCGVKTIAKLNELY